MAVHRVADPMKRTGRAGVAVAGGSLEMKGERAGETPARGRSMARGGLGLGDRACSVCGPEIVSQAGRGATTAAHDRRLGRSLSEVRVVSGAS
jgi:hypothetical protein